MLVEAYARFDAHQQLQLTPVIQYVDNPGFDSSGESVDSSQWVAGLRVNLTF
jgi:carbohydrate-selective porin OprB